MRLVAERERERERAQFSAVCTHKRQIEAKTEGERGTERARQMAVGFKLPPPTSDKRLLFYNEYNLP